MALALSYLHTLSLQVIANVKDEGANLVTLAFVLSSMVSCSVLGLPSPHASICFGHIMSKVCQHATLDEKVCVGMKEVSIKKAQVALQKTIT
jgi:hypothetical protein